MKKQKAIAHSAAILASIISMGAYAGANDTSVEKSPFYGVLEGRVTSVENKDFNQEVVRASIGAKGLYKYDSFKAFYHLDVDFAPAANSQLNDSVGPASPFDSDSDYWVRTAVVAFPTQYGKLVFGQGPSGNYLDVYKVLDLFKTNSWEPSSKNGNMLFDQGGYGYNILSYATPKFFDGRLQAKVTNLTLDDDNGEDSDALGYRLIYSKDSLYIALSRVDIDRLVGTDYHRNTLAASYEINDFYIAGLYELVQDSPKYGDQNNWGVALSYQLGETKLSLGYTQRDADVDAADDSLIVAGVKYQAFENLEFWAEAASTDTAEKDNLSAGVSLKF